MANTSSSSNRKIGSQSKRSRRGGLWGKIRATPRPIIIIGSLLMLGAIGTTLVSISNATAFQFVGLHPQASTQPETTSGRQLKSLTAWNGKIYAGYGDYNSNTGPVQLTPFDPATNSFASTPEHAADTESIEIWKQIGNKMFALHIDPKSHWGAAYSVSPASAAGTPTTWTNNMLPTMTHIFGVTSLSSTDIFMSGNKDNGSGSNDEAKVFRSTDGGVTWNESLSVPTRGGFNRMYFVGTVNGQIYAQNYSTTDFSGSNPAVAAWLFNGTSWNKTTPIVASGILTKSGEYAGKMLAMRGGALLSYDGRTATTVRSGVKDYKVHTDGFLYALTSVNGQVLVSRTKDLVSWEQISVAPDASSSMALLGNTIYVGTLNSELYKANIDSNVTDTTGPSISWVAPSAAYTVTTSNQFAVNASDAGGIDKVEYYAGSILLGYVTGSASKSTGCLSLGTSVSCATQTSNYPGSYVLNWNGTGLASGTYPLKAIAYDTVGNSKETVTVSITVPTGLAPADTQSPQVIVSNPTSKTRVRNSVTISATATDNDSITYMEAVLDGVVVASNTTGSISKNVPVTKGTHTLTITAKDRAGNTAEKTVIFNGR